MSIVKFLSLYEIQCDASWNLALPFPCVHRATAEEFKQKKPPSKILGTHYYDSLAATHFGVKYT